MIIIYFFFHTMLTFENPREMVVECVMHSKIGCRLLFVVMSFTITQQEILKSTLAEPYHCVP